MPFTLILSLYQWVVLSVRSLRVALLLPIQGARGPFLHKFQATFIPPSPQLPCEDILSRTILGFYRPHLLAIHLRGEPHHCTVERDDQIVVYLVVLEPV